MKASPSALTIAAIAAVLAVAVTLRLPGLTFGLPEYPHVDERTLVRMVVDLASELNPHNFAWPATLQVAVTLLGFLLYVSLGWVAGWYDSVASMRAAAWDGTLLVVARSVVLGFSLVTLLALYYLLSRRSKALGLMGISLLAVLPLHIRNSTYALPDVPATCLMVLALALAMAAVERPTRSLFVAAGAAAGLACATKYYAVASVAAVLTSAACLQAPWQLRLRMLLAGLASSLAAFTIICPYYIVDLSGFLSSLSAEARHQAAGHIGYEPSGNPLTWYLLEVLKPAATGPVLVAAAVGAIFAVGQRDRWTWPLLATFVAYSTLATFSNVSFDRYAIPALPLLSAMAAYGISQVSRFTPARTAAWGGAATLALFAVAMSVPVARATEVFDGLMNEDARIRAAAWIRREVPAGATWLTTPYGPSIEGAVTFAARSKVPDETLLSALNGEFDWVAIDSLTTGRLTEPSARQNHPDVVASQESVISAVLSRGVEVATFIGQDVGQSPTIRIYRVR